MATRRAAHNIRDAVDGKAPPISQHDAGCVSDMKDTGDVLQQAANTTAQYDLDKIRQYGCVSPR